MRLPFGLGRRDAGPAAVPGPGVSAAAPAAAAPRSRAWASLPPIQRTAGSMPLVAAPGTFAGGLPGSHALPPIVQPLGHEVSHLATPGLVVARTRPVEAAGTGSMPAPVQRRTARGARTTPVSAAFAAPAPEPDVIEHAAHEPAPIAVPAVAPIRTMPTVSRQSVRTPDRPLTDAAVAARPAAVQRAAVAAPASESSAGRTTVLPASGGMRRVPASMPVATPVVSRQASASSGDHAAPASPSPSAPSAPGRSGLGAPMTSLPASARPVASPGPVLSRSTTAGPMPIAASSLRAPVQRSAGAADAAPQLALGSGERAGNAPAAHLPDLPFLPVVRPGSAASSASTAATPAPVQMSAAPAGPEIRPIAGANPIRTSIAIQRDVEDGLEDEDSREEALPSPWWNAGDAPARAAGGGASMAAVEGSATSIQRSRADDGIAHASSALASVSRVAALAPVPALSGRTPVQRVAGSAGRQNFPALTLPHAAAAAGAAAAVDGGRQSITFPGASGSGAPSVQTSRMSPSAPLAASVGPGHGALVQREGGNVAIQAPAAPEAAGPAGPAAAVAQAGPIAPAGSASSGRSEKDLDELAQALFGRIRGRLRSDLIYDREAKGLTFDNV